MRVRSVPGQELEEADKDARNKIQTCSFLADHHGSLGQRIAFGYPPPLVLITPCIEYRASRDSSGIGEFAGMFAHDCKTAVPCNALRQAACQVMASMMELYRNELLGWEWKPRCPKFLEVPFFPASKAPSAATQ